MEKKVDIAIEKGRGIRLETLRAFAERQLPKKSILRHLILTEPQNELDAREFIGRVHVWLKILETDFSPPREAVPNASRD